MLSDSVGLEEHTIYATHCMQCLPVFIKEPPQQHSTSGYLMALRSSLERQPPAEMLSPLLEERTVLSQAERRTQLAGIQRAPLTCER